MEPAALVMHCLPADFDAATQTCAAPFWSYPAPIFPYLTIDQAQTIAWAIAALWGLAFGIKMIKRALTQIG